MGEIADMMLDGTLCQGCGVAFDETKGYPAYCSGCQVEMGIDEHGEDSELAKAFKGVNKSKCTKKVKCPHCNKRVKEVGLEQHMKDVHG